MIFALVLTTAYAIYYAVAIARDLQDRKGRANPTEEVFDLEGMGEEESVRVSESGDGFLLGDSGERPDGPVGQEEDERKQPAEEPRDAAVEKAERIRSGLSEAEIESEYGVDAPTLHELLEGKRETLFKPQMTVTRNEV